MSTTIKESIEEIIVRDSDGNETSTKQIKTTSYKRIQEPEFIKVYTRMWCEFNNIKPRWRELFLQLALRMTYCRSSDLNHSQIVGTGGPIGEDIRKTLGWSSRDALAKGLRELCECGAIRRLSRGYYQINPSYAGKGEWKYNRDRDQGGIEDLVAIFSFKNHTVETKIKWADNDEYQKQNENVDQEIGVKTMTVAEEEKGDF